MYFDMHVHDRGGKQSYKETEAHAIEVAQRAGVDGFVAMPNTEPPLTTRKEIEEKLERVDKHKPNNFFYGVYIGATNNPRQIREAVKLQRELFPRIVGFKLYMGKSVGDLAVTREDEQLQVFQTLRDADYQGIVVIHGEKESLLRPEIWNPNVPMSHSLARPREAEFISYRDAVEFAVKTGFRGRLHFTHVSWQEAAKYIDSIRKNLTGTDLGSFQVSCDVTPHHLFVGYEDMERYGGNELKVNPPLRGFNNAFAMQTALKEGLIDCIATDHAPHSYDEKTKPPHLSGIPGLDKWPRIAEKLREINLTEQQIADLTFNNPVRILGLEKFVTKTTNSGDLNQRAYSYGNYL